MYDIITRGICPEFAIEATRVCKELYGDYYLTHWMKDTKFDVLGLYISDSGLQIYTERARAEELEKEFKRWGLFYEVWSRWYGGSTYIVGFNFTYETFEKLSDEYFIVSERNMKLEKILEI